jgi:hypothetical protein
LPVRAPEFAVISGLVVWMVPMRLKRQRPVGCIEFNVPDCRFVPVYRRIYMSDYHEAAIFHVVERLERTARKHHRPF